MKMTSQSDLCTELDKVLHKNVYVPPSAWNQENTATIVDVIIIIIIYLFRTRGTCTCNRTITFKV